jgi:hypothetical protein
MIIDVLHGTETVPVACISVVSNLRFWTSFMIHLLLHFSKNGNKKS